MADKSDSRIMITPEIRGLNRKRELEVSQYKDELNDLEAKSASVKQSLTMEKFSQEKETLEDKLRQQTYGLVSKKDFQARRLALEAERDLRQSKSNHDKLVSRNPELSLSIKKKKQKKEKVALSFSEDFGEEEDITPLPKKRFGKDPGVNTAFLPDKDREEKEAQERIRLREEFLAKQESLKNEKVSIAFEHWDGKGKQYEVETTKGASIKTFLKEVQKTIPEIRRLSADDLMLIKGDLILPHHYTFYDFIITNAKGRCGLLFDFDTKKGMALKMDGKQVDTRVPKVVERHWYEKNKHIYPQSRWENYDPEKKWENAYLR
eukprot:TRINITY_DN5761_c0_g1_i1.p1 TRINITY_DN5761_c0_g1~~TRINITY_DN5761_c0_g1_i1.p1  ORF type:complete len:320 (-),score=82.66 TRINITY_DN5761_c0_g1_i1:71-1030(-)